MTTIVAIHSYVFDEVLFSSRDVSLYAWVWYAVSVLGPTWVNRERLKVKSSRIGMRIVSIDHPKTASCALLTGAFL